MSATIDLLTVSLGAILPVLGLASVGYVLGRRGLDVAPLNTVTVYVLAPALVFDTILTTDLGGVVVAKLGAGVIVYTVAMTLLAAGAARAIGVREPLFGALILAATYPNSGNMGIPVSDFAFGATGRSTAVLFLAVQSILIYTLGVYNAARGARDANKGGVAGDLRRVFGLPLVYAVVLAIGVRWLGVGPAPDTTIMRTIALTGDAAIPVLQLVLGASLARLSISTADRNMSLAGGLKLIVAPVIALLIAIGLQFGNPTVARVFVLEAAMPAAITPIVLVGEFGDTRTQGYLSAVILGTTLLSVPLLTVVIAVLRSGVIL